ncbi:MAG: hypothetical protein Q7R51_00210 [bacterium]|nr:hypothetical protein [bacterium]
MAEGKTSSPMIDVEGVQYYAISRDHDQLPDIITGTKISKKIASTLQMKGFSIRRSVFFDDVEFERANQARASRTFAIINHLNVIDHAIEDSGWEAEKTYYESRYEYPAKDLIARIKGAAKDSPSIRISADGKRVLYYEDNKRKSIKLLGKDRDQDYPSCEVLDACVYEDKLSGGVDAAITVLPESYRDQQNRVKKLFEIIGKVPPVLTVFFKPDGKIVEIDQWSDATAEISEVLQDHINSKER